MISEALSTLLDHHNLAIDDVRWYLSRVKAGQLLEFTRNPPGLVEEIWSGRLSDSLFNMEETFLQDLDRAWRTGVKDEAQVRSVIMEIKAAQRRRPRRQED